MQRIDFLVMKEAQGLNETGLEGGQKKQNGNESNKENRKRKYERGDVGR